MTFFDRPKPSDERDPAPRACVICGARVGSVALRSLTRSARDVPTSASDGPQWICRPCFEQRRGRAPEN